MKLDTLYKVINKEIFEGELDDVIFAYHYDPSMYGYHTVWDGQAIISIMAELHFIISATTMAHEMIHQWQYQNDYPRNHGKRFKKMARKIEKTYNLDKGEI